MILSRFKSYLSGQIYNSQNSQVSRRLFKGISWSLVGSIGGKVFQLIAFMVVARLIGKEDYGRVGIIRSTITMFMVFSTLGMSGTATRYISLYRNLFPDKAKKIYNFANRTTLIFGLVFAITVIIFSNYLAEYSLHDSTLSLTLKIAAICLLFLSINATQIGALNGFEDFKSVGINSVINGLIQLVLIVVGAYYWGINGVVVGLSVSAIVYSIQLNLAIKPNINRLIDMGVQNTEKGTLLSVFMNFSLPSLLASVTVVPVLWWTKTSLIQNGGFDEMAVFDVAEQWYYTLLFIPNAIGGIILPLLTNTSVEGTSGEYRDLIKINLWINVLITLFLAVLIGLFSPLINKLYGREFTDYYPMIILLITAIFCAANNVLGQVIASRGRMWIGFGLNSIWAVWIILFTNLFVIVLDMGALGLAFAMLASYLLHTVAQGYVALRWSKK